MDEEARKQRHGLWLWLAVVFVLLAGFGFVLNKPRSRNTSAATSCVTNLRQIDGAKDQWAIENKRHDGDLVSPQGVAEYIKGNGIPKCPAGGKYLLNRVGQNPTCTIGGPGHSLPLP